MVKTGMVPRLQKHVPTFTRAARVIKKKTKALVSYARCINPRSLRGTIQSIRTKRALLKLQENLPTFADLNLDAAGKIKLQSDTWHSHRPSSMEYSEPLPRFGTAGIRPIDLTKYADSFSINRSKGGRASLEWEKVASWYGLQSTNKEWKNVASWYANLNVIEPAKKLFKAFKFWS